MGDSKPQRSGIPILQRRGSASRGRVENPNSNEATESPGNEVARPPPSPPIDIPGRAHRVQTDDEDVRTLDVSS